MKEDTEIWTIGFGRNNADKSFCWDDSFPNLYDPDILIINLESLNEDVLKRIHKDKFLDTRTKIFNKFITGKTIIFFIADKRKVEVDTAKLEDGRIIELKNKDRLYSNYDISPIEFDLIKTKNGKNINFKSNTPFSSYFSKIKGYDQLLSDFKISSNYNCIRPMNDTAKNNCKFFMLDYRIL